MVKNNDIKYEPSDGKDCIFISYQSNSKTEAIKLSNLLEKNKIKTWYAPRNIEAGSQWAIKLGEAIKSCKALLLLFTKDADISTHVYREVNLADTFSKPILWINLDDTKPNNLIYYLNSIQWYESSDYTYLCDILKSDNIRQEILNNEAVEKKDFDNLPFNQWAKSIYAFDTAEEAAECTARVYFEVANREKNKLVLLPTGRSAKKVFYEMIKLSRNYKKNPFGKNFIMNDSEMLGVSMSDKTSRIRIINENLIEILKKMGKAPKQKYLTFYGMSGSKMTPDEFAKNMLAKHKTIVYGISVSPYMEIIGYSNGDNEPDIINDLPKVVKLTKDTQKYIDYRQTHELMHSIGLNAVLESEIMMVLAFDDNQQDGNGYSYEISKSNAIKRLFKGEETSKVPLTMLRKHSNAHVIITKEIAIKAGIIDYAIIDISPEEASLCITRK